MGRFLSDLAPADLAIITAVIFVPLLMIFGISAIRSEVRDALRIEAKSVRLKTSKAQRLQWRTRTTSEQMLNLLDVIETLLRIIHADDVLARQDHKEAVRLSWMSYRIPVRLTLLGSMLLAGVISAALVVIAQGPANSIP